MITKHADVLEIELHNKEWENAPRPVITNRAGDAPPRGARRAAAHAHPHGRPGPPRLPRRSRPSGSCPRTWPSSTPGWPSWPGSPSTRWPRMGGECDFARDIAMPYPLQVILAILGLPESDYPRMLQLTQELFGVVRRGARPRLASSRTSWRSSTTSSSTSSQLTEDRRAEPTDDLASAIANATIDGEPLGVMETISYYVIIATAGHDTTASSMAGGLHALAEHPDAAAAAARRPVADPDRGRRDHPLGHAGQALHAQLHDALRARAAHHFEPGDSVLLSYPSANRDEDVYDRPVPLRRRAQAEQAPRVRLRRALLPRRDAGPHGAEGVADRAGAPAAVDRAGRRAARTCRRCSSAGPKSVPIRYEVTS